MWPIDPLSYTGMYIQCICFLSVDYQTCTRELPTNLSSEVNQQTGTRELTDLRSEANQQTGTRE
jgi:hypothetical protein